MIDGFADGVICALGIITIGMIAGVNPVAIWLSAFGAGIAEFSGMAAGWYQSTPQDGVRGALACGIASVTGAVIPALPFLLWPAQAAFMLALALAAVFCVLIGWLHAEGGWRPYVVSVGATAVAVGLCVLAGMLPH